MRDDSPSGTPRQDVPDDVLELLRAALDLAREGRTSELAQYLDGGVPVNLASERGDTLLLLAAYYAHADTVEALLARGADTARVNDNGQTALAAAVFRRSEPIVRRLLDAGADPRLGVRSALSVADAFDLPDMRALLQDR